MKRPLAPALFCCLTLLTLLLPIAPARAIDNRDYIVGPEDILEIKVWSNDDLNRTVELSTEGAFTFPLIGKVQAGGLTVFEVEKLLRDKLADGYLTAPQVNVSVVKYKSQKVSILGEVKRPGSYFIKGKTHILELISEAEGLTEKAGRTVTIVRGQASKAGAASVIIDLEEVKQGSAEERLFVDNGDTIYVAEAPRIYVSGEVARPGEYRWRKDLTLEQALSLAGGIKDSAGRGVKILRPKTLPALLSAAAAQGNIETTTILIDLDDLKEGREGYFVADGDSIFVEEGPHLYLNGGVVRPGEYRWKKGLTLEQALSLAGGLKESAGRGVKIIRPKNLPALLPAAAAQGNIETTTILIDLDDLKEGREGYFVADGDSIFVEEAPWVYIVGEVNRPGRYKWEKKLTVNEAISLAGGPTKRAAAGRTEVIRQGKTGAEQVKTSPDTPVLPGDIIKVPESYL